MDESSQVAVNDVSINQRQCPQCYSLMQESKDDRVTIKTEGTDEVSVLYTFKCDSCKLKRHIRDNRL